VTEALRQIVALLSRQNDLLYAILEMQQQIKEEIMRGPIA
jgi:hypothetical protein